MKIKNYLNYFKLMKTAVFCCMLGSGFYSHAQYEPQFTQYMNNELFINPAYAGSRGFAAATLLYRDQWVGIEGAPRTATFGFHTPFSNDKAGLGICIMNDKVAVTNQTGVFLNYAYHLSTSEVSRLSFGLQGGIISVDEKLSDVTTIDPNDPQFSNDVYGKVMPNFGFGMYYHTNNKFYLGFSVPRFIENKIDASTFNTDNELNFHNWHYYLFSAYVFNAGESVKFKPSVMIKAVQGATAEMDITMNVLFKELFWLGVSYRTGDAVSFITQYQLTKQLRFGYSYDYSITKLNNYSSGTHEFTLGYDFSFDKAKVVTPRYF